MQFFMNFFKTRTGFIGHFSVNRFIISVTSGQFAVIFDKYRIFSFTDIFKGTFQTAMKNGILESDLVKFDRL